jgi:hypothetical protein
MGFCSSRAYNIENMVDIKNLKNFIMWQFVDFKYRIWWYHDWIFSILQSFPGRFLYFQLEYMYIVLMK